MNEIVFTIKLQIEGATVKAVDLQMVDEEGGRVEDLGPFERRVLGSADADHRPYMEQYIEAVTRRGARRLPPATGNRPYINFMPPEGRLEKRVSALAPSGRLAVFVDPTHASKFDHAEVVLNTGVPAYVKVYLKSEAAVRDGVALTRVALDER